MAAIPRRAHFVFGLKPQEVPFHPLHYVAIESCRRQLEPETIFFHYRYLPFGAFWDLARPHLTLVRAGLAQEVSAMRYDPRRVPERYLYAHHADFVRLDALLEHGGVYADIDTIFLRPYPDHLFDRRFVIGREEPVRDERNGELHPSLCNAVLMAAPGAEFAAAWRTRMGAALDGTWSHHSSALAERLSRELPHAVHVEPIESFYPVPCTRAGLANLLEEGRPDVDRGHSVHLWSHLWWDPERIDFSRRHAGDFTYQGLLSSRAPLARLARPYLPELDVDDFAPR
jgi:hypothetical protein